MLKKLISVLSAAALTASAMGAAASADAHDIRTAACAPVCALGSDVSRYRQGDVNMDGAIDTKDAIAVLTHYNLEEIVEAGTAFNADQLMLANVGDRPGESAVNAYDASLIMQYYTAVLVELKGIAQMTVADFRAYQQANDIDLHCEQFAAHPDLDDAAGGWAFGIVERYQQIADKLTAAGIHTIQGNNFQEASVRNHIINEVYAGDILRQKTFTPDPISKVKVKNNGELPQYLYSDAHEAIIDRETYALVQEELKRRNAMMNPTYYFTGLIKCECCGNTFTRQNNKKDGNSYPDKNDIEKANTTIQDMLAQKHFTHFDGINLNDGNGILLDITGEPDAKICDYDSIYYSKFLTTDYTRLRERDSLKSYISPDTTVPEATEPDTYAVVITSCSRTGEIKGADVAGFTTSYVCQNGSVSYVRRTLGDRWHVTAVRTCESKGLTWYELYDTDDGEYYGWVDANYITFYDEVPAVTAPVTEPTVSNWKAAYRIALDNFKNSARYQSDSMWDLADVDGDGTPELFISEGWAIACGVYLYYYDGKQAVLLDSDGNGNGDLLGSMGSIAICKEESLIESWYYNHGIQSDVIYRYANHTISKVGNFYNDEDASDDPGTYEVNGESVTSDVFEAALQEHNAKNWIGIGQKYEFSDYSALG